MSIYDREYGLSDIWGEYEVFARDWWRWEKGRLVPYPGAPEEFLGYADTEEQARMACREYNDSHEPGDLSRKAEYRSV